MTHTVSRYLLAALIALMLLATSAYATTIEDRQSCESIGGSWGTANPPQFRSAPAPRRYGRCSLRQNYTVPSGSQLRIEVGVELSVTYGGRLTNDGYIEIPNTAALIVVGGRFFNRGNLYADNSGEVWYFLGAFDNSGTMSLEGDLYTQPLWTPTPQGPNDCLNNRFATIELFSGGNLYNEGCVDSWGTGAFDVYSTGTIHNYANAHYRTGQNDLMTGRVFNEAGGYIEVDGHWQVQSGGQLSNAGHLKIVDAALTVEQGATMTTASTGHVELAGGDFVIDGEYTLDSGVMTATGGQIDADTLRITDSGRFEIESGSELWNPGFVDVVNNGTVLLKCIVRWYPTLSFTGNTVFRQHCNPPPIKPPIGPIVLPNL